MEYLLDSGEFLMCVLPAKKTFYILDDSESGRAAIDQFVQGESVSYDGLQPMWFAYDPKQPWQTFSGEVHSMPETLTETELIERFVLKKNNFGSIVATRNPDNGKVKIFKREKLVVD